MDIFWNYTFSPSSSIPLTTAYLGHFAENHGEHYVSLTPGVQNGVSGCNDYMKGEDDVGDAINDNDRPNDAIAGGVYGTDDSQDQQFLNNDVLEIIIKLALCAFPFMRTDFLDQWLIRCLVPEYIYQSSLTTL